MSKSERRNLNNTITGIVLVVCMASTTGCMSLLVSGGGTGGEPSAGTKIAAGTVDVVTLPVQAIVFAGWWSLESAHEAKQGKSGARGRSQNLQPEETLRKKLEQDPEIVFREGWHTSSDGEKIRALLGAFTDERTPFTDGMLRRIFAESSVEGVSDWVFYHPACSTNFLIENFPEALQRCESQARCVRLEAIVLNTNTPIELVRSIEEKTNVVPVIGPVRKRLGLPPLR